MSYQSVRQEDLATATSALVYNIYKKYLIESGELQLHHFLPERLS